MPALLEVANFDKSQSYDFTDGASVIRLISGTFSDTTSEHGESVELRFQTIAKGSAVQIREAMRDVERVFKRATVFHNDPTEQNSIWINAKSDGNEKERRTLVMSWQRTDTTQKHSDPLLDRTLIVISDWSIIRNGYWEAIPANAISLADSNAFFTGLNDYGAYAGNPPPSSSNRGFALVTAPFGYGTAPGRILSIGIKSSTQDMTQRFWFGIKPVNASVSVDWAAHASFDGTYGNPFSYWDFNDDFSEGLSLNGKCGKVTFVSGSNKFYNRAGVIIPPSALATPAPNELVRGTYLVLFRMKGTDGADTFRTSMFFTAGSLGFPLADTFHDVFIESQDYYFYEMGVIQVPPEGFREARRNYLASFEGFEIGLAAERLSGTSELLIDYAVIIPQEHAVSSKGMYQEDAEQGYIITDEDDNIVGISQDNGVPPDLHTYIHELSASNWTFPADNSQNAIVVSVIDAVPGSTKQDLDQTCTYSMKIVPRYFSYNAD